MIIPPLFEHPTEIEGEEGQLEHAEVIERTNLLRWFLQVVHSLLFLLWHMLCLFVLLALLIQSDEPLEPQVVAHPILDKTNVLEWFLTCTEARVGHTLVTQS